jgi:hypothetical protein
MVIDHEGPDPRLAEAIGELQDREPVRDLWPGISRRIERRPPGTLELRWTVAAAAALTLLIGGAALSRLIVPVSEPAATPVATAPPQEASMVLPAGFSSAEASLTAAIDQLEQAYLAAAPTLDPEVRLAISNSLASLDTAIVDARSRAGSAPTDVDAARYLTRTMQRKLNVLRTATNMVSRS